MWERFLIGWVNGVARYPNRCLFLILIVTALCGWVAYTQFRLNSELGELIDQTSSWRLDFDAFEAKFPDLVRTAVIVVKGTSLKGVEDATREIVAQLEAREDRFTAIAAPGSEQFFRDHALLYMSLDNLDDTADRLAEAQPMLSAVVEDGSLVGVLELLADGVENDPPTGMRTILDNLNAALSNALSERSEEVAWTDEFFDLEEARYQLIYLKPQSAYDEVLPDALVVEELRQMIAALKLREGVEVALTGEIPLQHEEIEAAIEGVSIAGWLALGLLFLVLLVGVRSGKIILATFAMLAIGVIWTSAFAMLSVGEYNTLSLVFIVMFFGLGVDFALHFSLRYQEAVNRGDLDIAHALAKSTGSVGRAISLCSLTTALGFLCFYPTAYEGLADLGIISAGGMFIACFLTFTFLPAFYARFGAPRAHEMDLPTSEGVVRWLMGHRLIVVVVIAALGMGAALLASRASFDYSTLALKDPNSESMLTLRELQREELSTDYQLVVVAEEAVDAARLDESGVVNEVRVFADLVPDDQDEKLAVLEDLQFMLWSLVETDIVDLSLDAAATKAAADNLITVIDRDGGNVSDVEVRNALSQLKDKLAQAGKAEPGVWRLWQENALTNLLQEIRWLQRALLVEEVTMSSIPDEVRARIISDNGEQLSVITPVENIAAVDALSRFISAVRDVYPNATGRPVIEWGVGQIVIQAFKDALLYALIGIGLVLILALRRVGPTLLVLCPLILAGLFTFALSVVFDKPINMANVIVLPLIFGLGVDNGIHVVDRFLGEGDVDHFMHSSTPRAVLLSTMTTIGAFAALSISPHAGTGSIGLLLTISIGFLLIFTVFLLPVLLSFLPGYSPASAMDNTTA